MELDRDGQSLTNADQRLHQTQTQIREILGEENGLKYLAYLKDWLRGRCSQEDFDFFGLAVMPEDKRFLHTELLLTLLNYSEVKRRMLLATWENGFKQVSEGAIDSVVVSTKILLMNLLEASVRLKRNHLVSEDGSTHSYGISKRSNVRPASRVVLPACKPISARDLLDGLQVEDNLVKSNQLRDCLIAKLKAVESREPDV